MLKLVIKTIPHHEQRYTTVGDWWEDEYGTIHIRVSDMGNFYYEALVGIHEFAEYTLCRIMGITQAQVDRFDQAFEAARPEGNTDEPGDDPRAPYRVQHCIATGIERIVAGVLGISWKEYDDAVNAL